jgi:hypothetical protein
MVARAVLIIPPFFCFSKREGEERGLVLGHSLILWLLLVGGGALTAVFWTVLERLISLEVQLVKLLISNGRHAV